MHRLTPVQADLLRRADELSLPGDGVRVRGAGRVLSARALERHGLARLCEIPLSAVYGEASPGYTYRLHITPLGRRTIKHYDQQEVRPTSLGASQK